MLNERECCTIGEAASFLGWARRENHPCEATGQKKRGGLSGPAILGSTATHVFNDGLTASVKDVEDMIPVQRIERILVGWMERGGGRT